MSSQEMDQVEGVVAAAAEESKEESRDTYDEKSLDSDVKGSEETATTEGEETNGAPESEGGEAEAEVEEKEQEGEEEEQEEEEEAAAEAEKNGEAEAADPAPATAAEEVNGNDRKRVSDAGDSAEAAEEIPCKKQKVDEEEATEADCAAEAVAAE